MLVTVHSLVLLESRCAECYGQAGEPILRNSCCDGGNFSSCPTSCDIVLRFCQLSDLQQFDLAGTFLGTQCAQSPLFGHAEDFLGFDSVKAGETFLLTYPLTYNEAGKWVSNYRYPLKDITLLHRKERY